MIIIMVLEMEFDGFYFFSRIFVLKIVTRSKLFMFDKHKALRILLRVNNYYY